MIEHHITHNCSNTNSNTNHSKIHIELSTFEGYKEEDPSLKHYVTHTDVLGTSFFKLLGLIHIKKITRFALELSGRLNTNMHLWLTLQTICIHRFQSE